MTLLDKILWSTLGRCENVHDISRWIRTKTSKHHMRDSSVLLSKRLFLKYYRWLHRWRHWRHDFSIRWSFPPTSFRELCIESSQVVGLGILCISSKYFQQFKLFYLSIERVILTILFLYFSFLFLSISNFLFL